MHYLALATDYDGTLATHGLTDEPTLDALKKFKDSGRKLLLVTGRELFDLERTFPHLDLFDRIVAENGALLYRPQTKEEKILAAPPPKAFAEALRHRGVTPLSEGRSIVATFEPHEKTVLEVIHEMGLELQVIFNKGAVMVLPSGVNKAFGLEFALEELQLSRHNVAAVGDAENDHAFLDQCGFAVAVSNALPTLKEKADFVTLASHGAGVAELIGHILADDLSHFHRSPGPATDTRHPRPDRHALNLGTRMDNAPALIPALGGNLLLAGTSGGGKSTFTTGFIERLAEGGYQFCLIDPEGDYEGLGDAVVLGDADRAPGFEEVMQMLEKPSENVAVCTLAVPLADRPAFFSELYGRLSALKNRTGRPHWIVIDEAHHLLPEARPAALLPAPNASGGHFLITLEPSHVHPLWTAPVDTLLAIGREPRLIVEDLARVRQVPPPSLPEAPLRQGEAIVWNPEPGEVYWMRTEPPKLQRRRHVRKYSAGELLPEENFVFKGPDGKLNLKAQNLLVFLQMADGVDEATWLHHLRQRDYSSWFSAVIKDPALAQEAERVESDTGLTAAESRSAIRRMVEKRYTGAA